MKNIIKTLGIVSTLTLGVLLIQNNPTFAKSTDISNVSDINTNIDNSIIYTQTTKSAVNVERIFDVDLNINNIKDISAQDIMIKYNSDKLRYLGMSNVKDGLLIIDNETTTPSALRFILASNGEDNVINTKESILKLNFQATTTGSAVI